MNPNSQKIQALLFSEGGSMTKKRISQLLGIDTTLLKNDLSDLSKSLEGSGLSLVVSDTEAALVVSSEARDAVRSAQEKDLGREIGDAGLEVLAIILYRGPSTRAQIDYIRGVNTSSTVRNLLARGLLERAGNPEDGREYIYRATTDLLAHLGVRNGQELPEYATISSELANFEKTQEPLTEHADATDTVHDEGSH